MSRLVVSTGRRSVMVLPPFASILPVSRCRPAGSARGAPSIPVTAERRTATLPSSTLALPLGLPLRADQVPRLDLTLALDRHRASSFELELTCQQRPGLRGDLDLAGRAL